MFKTVLSLQARPIIEGRNLGIRTPLRVVATCRSTSAGLSKLGATPTAQTGTKTHRENCDNEEGKSGKNNIHTFQSRIFNTLPRSIRLPAASRPACLLVPGSCGPWSLADRCAAIQSSMTFNASFLASSFVLFFFFDCALRQWRRGNIALITTQPVPDCLNSVQHLQPLCLEDRFLRQQTKREGSYGARSLQHILSHPLAVLRLPGSFASPGCTSIIPITVG